MHPPHSPAPLEDAHPLDAYACAESARGQAWAVQIHCLHRAVTDLGGRLTPVSLELPPGLSFEQYRDLAQLLPPPPPGGEKVA